MADDKKDKDDDKNAARTIAENKAAEDRAKDKAKDDAELGKKVAAVAKSQDNDFVFASAGDQFTIRGDGFSASGTVRIEGQDAFTTAWGNNLIEGRVPAGVKKGTVAVAVVNGAGTQRGTFEI